MRQKRNPIIYVRADSLKVHPVAQRDILPTRLNYLKNFFDLDAVGTFQAVDYEREGEPGPWVVDGQHRLVSMLNLGLGEWRVNVEIHSNIQDDAAAQNLFLRLNNRAAIASWFKFINRLGGGDPVAISFDKISKANGLIPSRTPSDGHVVCTETGMAIIEKRGEENLGQTYHVATTAWGKKPAAVEGKLLDGISLVLEQYNGELDTEAFIKKLSKYPGGASGILGDAKGLQRIKRGRLSARVKETLVEAYNTGRRGGKLV